MLSSRRYDHIFGFKGNEFYFKSWGDALAGRTFGEVAAMFPEASDRCCFHTPAQRVAPYLQ